MAVVNTNVSASVAQNALSKNERAMNTAIERLSTGKRINGAKDDAAGLAISSRMTSQIRGLEAGMKNAGDAISMISVADGAMVEIGKYAAAHARAGFAVRQRYNHFSGP